jgi:hypothetical protein
MPPWKPVQSCGVFDSPRVLSRENIVTIPPGDANDRVNADFRVPAFPAVNVHVWLIAPHMRLLGRKDACRCDNTCGTKPMSDQHR